MKSFRWVRRILLLMVTALLPLQASAFTPYDSYTYSTATGTEKHVHSPAPFIPGQYLNAEAMGVTLSQPSDFTFGPDGSLYIVDTGQNRIVVLDEEYRFVREIAGFTNEGKEETFSSPQGLFVASNGSLYICDTENSRIVYLDAQGELVRIYTCPETPALKAGYVFKPLKIAVDDAGTLYVINTDEYSGLMKITAEGKFVSFIGSNKAIVNPVVQFWKNLLSPEQRDQMMDFIPVEFNNISMDDSGFIFAVSASTAEDNPIKRLNLSGDDILVRSGYVDVMGDVLFKITPDPNDASKKVEDRSVLVDICSSSNGNYFVLDSKKGRIFTYNREGYLLYAFGTKGTQIGTFQNPCAIEVRGENLLVLDQVAGSITIFNKTKYAKQITKAEDDYYSGRYEESMEGWNEVLRTNAFFEFAYQQQGKIYLHQGDDEMAMKCFELGNYRGDKITFMTGYNKAFTEFRKDFMSQYLGVMVIGGVGLWLLLYLLHRWRKKRKGKKAARPTGGEDR